jgi:hypothetical protein
MEVNNTNPGAISSSGGILTSINTLKKVRKPTIPMAKPMNAGILVFMISAFHV